MALGHLQKLGDGECEFYDKPAKYEYVNGTKHFMIHNRLKKIHMMPIGTNYLCLVVVGSLL